MSMARARKEYEWNEANRIQIRFKMDNIGLQLAEFMENEARSCSMDLTLSKPLTLDNVKASFPLYSLNRGFWVCNARVCI